MNKLLFSAMVLALATPFAAQAEEPVAPPASKQAIDPAKKAEWEAKRAERMARVDTDKDGMVSKSEFMVEHERRGNDIFAKLDTNADGKLTKEEMEAGRKKMREKFMKHRMERKGDQPASPAGKAE